MNIKGGYTTYGQDIGILMMDTVFPRLVGDIGNARSFSVPVRYHVVRDVNGATLTGQNAHKELLKPFVRAAQELEATGCRAITTSCSFLGGFQQALAQSVNIPVFTSTLLLAPMLHAMLKTDRKIGILSECPKLLGEEAFRQAGWSAADIPVCVSGPAPGSEFSRLVIGDNTEGNVELLRACIAEMTGRHMQENPDTGALLLECTNFAPFTRMIAKIAGVPVFGINQLIEYMDACINPREYDNG